MERGLEDPSPVRGLSWPWWAAIGGVLALHLQLAVSSYWVAEDAYITFRYSRNLISGHGLRFNPGDVEAVEGYSNFLWLLIAAIPEIFGWYPV